MAAFRQYLRERPANRADEELLAAKIVMHWPSGAPLALAPERDDLELGADGQGVVPIASRLLPLVWERNFQ